MALERTVFCGMLQSLNSFHIISHKDWPIFEWALHIKTFLEPNLILMMLLLLHCLSHKGDRVSHVLRPQATQCVAGEAPCTFLLTL